MKTTFLAILISFKIIFALGKPSINSISENLYQKLGDTVELNCRATKNYDQPIFWLKKGNSSGARDDFIIAIQNIDLQQNELQNNTKYEVYTQKYTTEEKYTLKIHDIDIADNGTYICKIISFDEEDVTAETNLFVSIPAKAEIKNGTKVEVLEGDDVVLECIGTGDPIPTVYWNYKKLIGWENRKMMSENHVNYTFNGNPGRKNYVIPAISKTEAGTYFCTATNNIKYSSTSIEVAVKFPPKVKAVWPTRQSGSFALIELACHVFGYPEPTVTWFKGDYSVNRASGFNVTNVHTNDQVSISVLQIDTTIAAELSSGDYRCRASNELGEATAKMIVLE